MKIEVQQLSLNDCKEKYDMLQTIRNNENGFYNPVFEMSYKEYLLWLQREDDYSKGNHLPESWIPQTTFFLFIDDEPIGIGRIRHKSSKYLESIGVGNLGYAISELHRGKGYGNILFRELLKKCISFGYDQIKLFPYKNNIPTVNIMLKNGGQITDSFDDEKYIVVIPTT
ncbi:GNAT family N-acetyltransferase [Paenibacillus sp. 5J-6]|uniref:GNAT family N-acetyltransferase n=1 Tax=Paenibacillus silvestris TaxID=2606219 RepID=A0A6L8UYH9_9BACL|nr:GNAT family N-acetyltransferase [Paenibacillus silvestris]MZQ83278.1 GNAT family N-acetyltransferase [Paenibacillus silvestris]